MRSPFHVPRSREPTEEERLTAHLSGCVPRMNTQGFLSTSLFSVCGALFNQDPEGISLDTSHSLVEILGQANR